MVTRGNQPPCFLQYVSDYGNYGRVPVNQKISKLILQFHGWACGIVLKISRFPRFFTLLMAFHVLFSAIQAVLDRLNRDNITFPIPGVLLPWKMAPEVIGSLTCHEAIYT